MHVIHAVNVADAYVLGLRYLRTVGEPAMTRAGEVLVAPTPVTTVYLRPLERILFDAVRDANPFFTLFEPMWMLAGRQDARWLDQFVHDFSARFAEADGHMHGAYGYRWRRHFNDPGWPVGMRIPLDQLDVVVEQLRENPGDRQVVIQMWDPEADLTNKAAKDRPCNLCVLPRIIGGALYITVFCRSNDIVWGAYSANAAQFSFLQEYLAARIGVEVGSYTQISNNYHVYTAVLEALETRRQSARAGEGHPVVYPEIIGLVSDPDTFDDELQYWFGDRVQSSGKQYRNTFIPLVLTPMLQAHRAWKNKQPEAALSILRAMPDCDWKVAAQAWLTRRMVKRDTEPKEYVR